MQPETRPTSSPDLVLTQYLTLALGALFLGLSLALLILRARFVAGAKPVSAVISDVAVVGRDTVKVRFNDGDGNPLETRLLGARRSVGPAGTPLQVLFNPARPAYVIANTWRDTWSRPLTGVMVGIALVSFHLIRVSLF